MTPRKLASLAAALGIVTLVLGHDAAGQPSQTPSAAPPSPSEAASWHTMTGPESSFTADMPAAPKYTTMPTRSAGGSSYTMHQYLLERDDVTYVVQTAIYPAEVNVSNHRVILQGGLDHIAKNIEGGRWESVGWVTHQGLIAVDSVGVRNGHAIRSFSVMKGRQIFTLTYAGPQGSARSADVNRFVVSLRFAK